MSEYLSMKSIKIKNEISAPRVIAAGDNLTLDDIINLTDPLQEVYADSYKYLEVKDTSSQVYKLVKKAEQKNMKSKKLVYFPDN